MNHGHVLVKVYGHLWPAGPEALLCVRPLLPQGMEPVEEMLVLEGDLLRLAFEGLYFPLDEVLEALVPCLRPDSQGKIDYLDMEAWSMTRCRFHGGTVERSHASLNAVLEYSGH